MDDQIFNPTLTNPFDPQHPTPPFAGRDAELARLHQAVTAPGTSEALVFLGRRRTGKTGLLKQFDHAFDELFIGVFLPLDTAPLHSESAWLRTLYQMMYDALIVRGFSQERLPHIPEDLARVDAYADDWRAWLVDEALPEIARVIRAARRIVLLMDDAGYLLDAIEKGTLPRDHGAFLARLIHPQLHIVLTADADEARLELLSPLVNPMGALRLGPLSREGVAAVLAFAEMSAIDTGAVAEVFAATGGLPELVRRAGYHLYEHDGKHDDKRDDKPPTMKDVLAQVYADGEATFRQMWDGLNRGERLVLTAIAGLIYADPLRPITPDRIEAWLVETDFPQDLTTVQATVRGLEYREIIRHELPEPARDHPGGLRLTAGLMQRWLLENARLNMPAEKPSSEAARPVTRDKTLPQSGANGVQNHRILWVAVAIAAVLFVLLMLALTSGGAPVNPSAMTPQPTVTLAR